MRLFILLMALGAGPSVALAEGDIAYGKYLASACVTCHQLTGVDNGIPSIVGWDQNSFIKTLQSYQTKERENAVMQMITAPMTGEEMESLAAYFATIKPKSEKEQ